MRGIYHFNNRNSLFLPVSSTTSSCIHCTCTICFVRNSPVLDACLSTNYLECHEVTEAPVIFSTTETVKDFPVEARFWVFLVDECNGGLSTHIPTTARKLM